MVFADIETMRIHLGVTQRSLCERAGVHYMTYSSIKNGRQVPNLRTLQKLETALQETHRLDLEKSNG